MGNNDKLPTVVKEGAFNLFGVDVKCYVLSDSKRIIEQESMIKLFEAMGNPDVKIDKNELEHFAKWAKGIDNL